MLDLTGRKQICDERRRLFDKASFPVNLKNQKSVK